MKIRNKTGRSIILSLDGRQCDLAPGAECVTDSDTVMIRFADTAVRENESVTEHRTLRGGIGVRYGKTFTYSLISDYSGLPDGEYDASVEEYPDTSVFLPEHRCVYVKLSGAPEPSLSFPEERAKTRYKKAIILRIAAAALFCAVSGLSVVYALIRLIREGGVMLFVISAVFFVSFLVILVYGVGRYRRLCR